MVTSVKANSSFSFWNFQWLWFFPIIFDPCFGWIHDCGTYGYGGLTILSKAPPLKPQHWGFVLQHIKREGVGGWMQMFSPQQQASFFLPSVNQHLNVCFQSSLLSCPRYPGSWKLCVASMKSRRKFCRTDTAVPASESLNDYMAEFHCSQWSLSLTVF